MVTKTETGPRGGNMTKEIPLAIIRNAQIRDVLASKFGCNGTDISITQAGQIKVPGRGTIVNNVDDFWTLLFGRTPLTQIEDIPEAAPYCMNCGQWGPKWIRELCRECTDPRNNQDGTVYISGPCMSCNHFERRVQAAKQDPPPGPPPAGPDPTEPRKPRKARKKK